MEVKLTIIVLFVVALMVNMVAADLFFNHPLPKAEDIDGSRYKCVPGRTVIKVNQADTTADHDSDSEEVRLRNGPTRKQITLSTKDESCQVCVCSAEGLYEHCSNRPTETVNECLVLKGITEKFNMGLPYEHTRDLFNRIRRDYIWHNDELPYKTTAKCFRGHSFYTNSITANDTDVDVGTDVDSLLDYDNNMTCYFCICHTSGDKIACINRDTSVCEYYRYIRSEENINKTFMSHTYDNRPMYFRQLSYQLRRTMDSTVFDMLDAVNTDPSGNRHECVPYVSQYSNCNDDNLCSGCHECKCIGEGEWECEDIKKCPEDNDSPDGTENREEYDVMFDNALEMLDQQMRKHPLVKVSSSPYVPAPIESKPQDDLIAPFRELKLKDFLASLSRPKRSTAINNNKHGKRSIEKTSHNTINSSYNNTVKYYDTIDDLNEDTLKNSNLTGTLDAKKMDLNLPFSNSRRSYSADNSSKALQIEYNRPKTYNQITDNKIEATEQDNHFDASHESLKTVFGNFTQNTRNNDLSKIVVNELKTGREVIGDAAAVPVSNITFTSENDTLNAMAFIAGNLLNKLWNMEKDADASSIEIDALKHDKISNLLELFKEPLNIRQETFLKNALEQLSKAVDKDKDAKNTVICDTIQKSEKLLDNTNSTDKEETTTEVPCRKKSGGKDTENESEKEEKDNKQRNGIVDMEEINKKKTSLKAIAKLNNVLDLIKKFESIQGKLNELKLGHKLDFNHSILNNKNHELDAQLTKDEKSSLNMFGSLLEKITNLILPQRNNKKIANVINSQNVLKGNDNLKKQFKKMFNIDLSDINVSAKDKIILDYLSHVDRNPDCLLNKQNIDVEAMPSVDGNILRKLSKFYKLNSFGVLIKLLEPEKLKESLNESKKQIVATTPESITEKDLSSSSKGIDSHKFLSAKEKLKVHLKTIMEDLMELQSAKGVNFKSNIKMEEVLPCIYNLLKADSAEIVNKKKHIDPFEKIANVFKEIKKELNVAQSRRNFVDIMTERPKSVVVWERIVKNLNDQSRRKTRRSSNQKEPKSYDQIKKSMERIENGSSTYKQHALQVEVPAAGKLMLLKTLQQDVQATMNVINDIKVSLDDITKLPGAMEKLAELDEFVENRMTSVKLNEKINEKVKSELRKLFVSEINMSNQNKYKLKKQPILKTSQLSEDSDKMKISRVQIVSQLIRNRMESYLKQKDASGTDAKQDLNYSIAQRILYYLDTGNYKLANELFRWLVSQKLTETASDKYVVSTTPKHNTEKPLRRMAGYQKKGPLLLEDPNTTKAKQMTWAEQDRLIKQLLNIKNM